MARAEASAPGRMRDPVFAKRVVSALILAPLALLFVWIGGAGFAIFVAAFAAAMGWEWVRMSDKNAPPRAFAIATGTAVGAALLGAQAETGWMMVWIACGAGGAWFDRRPRGRAHEAFGGVAYIAASAGVLVLVRTAPDGGLTALAYLLGVVWAADIFAYLVGTWIGGPRLLPIASPNKTWSGLLAGLAFGIAAGAGLAWMLGLDVERAAWLAGPLALAAVLGDLLMSLAKRRFGVKDAGSLIPGHGGVLDRVDALMLATLFCGGVMLVSPGTWPGIAS